jgi:uncharacterized membrane protein YedE/YeeE
VNEVLAAVGVGFAFGWLLQRAGLSRYDRIVGVYRFTDLAVVKFLLSALVVGALCMRALVALGYASSVPVPPTYIVGNIGGGILFGVGMAASGFCPGTIAAGAGEGRLDYLIPGMLGLVGGALAFGLLYAWVFPIVGRDVHPGATLPASIGGDPWLVVVLLVEIALFIFYVIERPRGKASA